MKIGSTWPWWSTVSSSGSLCLCVWSGQWASSYSPSSRVLTLPLLKKWTITEFLKLNVDFNMTQRWTVSHSHSRRELWIHSNTVDYASASHHTLTGNWKLCTLALLHHLPTYLHPVPLHPPAIISSLVCQRKQGGFVSFEIYWLSLVFTKLDPKFRAFINSLILVGSVSTSQRHRGNTSSITSNFKSICYLFVEVVS